MPWQARSERPSTRRRSTTSPSTSSKPRPGSRRRSRCSTGRARWPQAKRAQPYASEAGSFAGLSFSRYRFVTNSRSLGLTMASMALPEPSVSGPPITIGRKSQRLAWALWIAVTVIGAVVGALAAWQVRELAVAGPASLADAFRYVATVLDAVVAAGAQWYVLRRYRLQVYLWGPATVTARLVAAIVVIPSVLGLFVPPVGNGPITLATAVTSGVAALAAAGLVIGTAQALVLRGSGGNIALAWIPATIAGGALAGALTTALSAQLFGLLPIATIGLVAAAGALLSAARQSPGFLRLVRLPGGPYCGRELSAARPIG